jgi:Arc/MetJ-type ribon-helix-helix transcriptional regulator
MQITLTKEQEDWLHSQVVEGRYATMEEAIAAAIDLLQTESDDAGWLKPLVAEGLAELDRGEAVPGHEVFAHIEARLREKL